MKILFVDCDGTIREPLSGEKFAKHPKDFKIIEGADQAISYYQRKGYRIEGITNQGGVEAGHKTLDDCIQEQLYTLELFPEISSILFCPDYAGKQCWRVYNNFGNKQALKVGERCNDLVGTYRKPGAGMIEYLLRMHLAKNRQICYMVGDRPEDKQAATKANIKFIDAEEWRKKYGFN